MTAAHPNGQFPARKFKAILLGLPGFGQCLLQMADLSGVIEDLLLRFGALLLKLLQFRFGLRESAVEALLIETETGEQIGPVVERFGLGEGAVDLGVRCEGFGLFLKTQREEIVFHGSDAIETPVGVGDGLNRFGFEQTCGLSSAKNCAQEF